VTNIERTQDSQLQRISFLAGQAFALGLTMAWILIPASAIFLARYGSDLLPVTYVGAAIAGIAASKLLAAALRRRPLAAVAAWTLAGLSSSLLASWLLLWKFEADWVAFGLLVLVPIVVPVGFMFVVGQAGALVDVRTLKALYARVVAGFASGFAVGGLAAPRLLTLLGSPAALLAAAAVASAVFLTLVVVTRQRYLAELSVVDHGDATAEQATSRVLLRHRYVMLIVAFQMLSAVESQWLDFLVFDRAAQRYHDSNTLARFVSQFAVIAYGLDILFLLLLAGVLLHRFGLRYGLTANALGVLALVAAMIVAASLYGSDATSVFLLIVAARVADLVLSDGAARTSLSAAYQAVPNRLRLAAQANIEGLAIPVAIGLSGVVLLLVRAAGRLDGSVLPVLTGVVVVAWTVVAVLLYREYRTNLLANLRQRALDPAELTLEETDSLSVIDRLLASDHERDIRLGLDVLTSVRHPELPMRLENLTRHERAHVRTDALERLLAVDVHRAERAARDALDDPSPTMTSMCIRVLRAVADPSDLTRIASRSNDPSPEVRVAVAATLSRMGGDAAREQVATEVSRLARSDAPHERVIAADLLRECELGCWADPTILRGLLADPDIGVVNAALAAIRWPEHAELVDELERKLRVHRTARAAVDALVRGGDAVLEVVDRGFGDDTFGERGQVLLARVCRTIDSESSGAILLRHVDHPNRAVGLAVMTALAVRGRSDAAAAVVRADLEHATHLLATFLAFDDGPATAPLRSALRDELELVRHRVFAGLSVSHGTDALNKVRFQFSQQDGRSHALAIEWLDVTLTGPDRAVLAILQPDLSDHDRMALLTRRFPIVVPSSQLAILVEIVGSRDGRWRNPWIQACAVYAAGELIEADLDVFAAAVDRLTPFRTSRQYEIVEETVAVVLQRRLGRRPQL
jgi:hypothetical protein